MRTAPTGFQNVLEERGGFAELVTVYELELDAGTLYYSDRNITWGGNTYTALAVQSGSFVEELGPGVPRFSVTFSHVPQTLLAHIEPTDLIAGKRLVVRILARDRSGLLADSIVRHIGHMERPAKVDATTVKIESIGLCYGRLGAIPPRRASLWCNVHKFADGTDCNYTQTTQTASATGSPGSTIEVDDASLLQDELDRAPVGHTVYVFVGSNTGLTLVSTTSGTPDTITISESISWSMSDAVGFSGCDRTYKACTNRERTHEFQGFRGMDGIEQDRFVAYGGPEQYATPAHSAARTRPPRDDMDDPPVSLADRKRIVPVIYGLRRTEGILIERLWKEITVSYGPGYGLDCSTILLCEGEIESVDAWFLDGDRVPADTIMPNVSAWTNGWKSLGIFYRVGEIGVDGSETEADYQADPSTRQRPNQDRDYWTNTQDPYSRSAYAIFVQRDDSHIGKPAPNYPNIFFSIKGLVHWRYTNASTPTHDPADGPAKVWTRNPVWQVVDLLTAYRYGLGRLIAESDFDFTVIKDEADFCDVSVTGIVATVSGAWAGVDLPGQACVVDDVSGFHPGMTVEYDDGSPVFDVVVDVYPSVSVISLNDSHAFNNGDTITADPERYSCDVTINSARNASAAIAAILATCNGYLTYSEEGKIQVRVERAVSSVATFAEFDAATGYQLRDFSYHEDDRIDPDVNRVSLEFVDMDDVPQEVVSTDFDHLETPNPLKELQLTVPGILTPDVAQRICDVVRKRQRLGVGAEFTVGPVGMLHQPGDVITVTEDTVSGWSAKDVRIIRTEQYGHGSSREYLTRLSVEPYDASVYDDTTRPSQPPSNTITPTVTAALDQNGMIFTLTWLYAGGQSAKKFIVYKSDATFSGAPDYSKIVIQIPATNPAFYNEDAKQGKFVYQAAPSEVGSTLYFVVTAHTNKLAAISNEVSGEVALEDPTTNQRDSGINTIYDGGFNIPHQWELSDEITPSDVKPDAHTGDYSSGANAYDSDASTYATGLAGGSDTHTWSFPGSGTKQGVFQVIHDGSSTLGGNYATLRYSVDGGSNYVDFFQAGEFGKTTSTSPVVEGDRSDLRLQANCVGSVLNPERHRVYEISWLENGSPTDPETTISGGILTIRGDGTNYAVVKRPWPGASGQYFNKLTDGKELVAQIKFARSPDGAPSHDLEMFLISGAGAVYTLTTVDTSDIVDAWHEQAEKWAPGSTLVGPFQVGVRTKSTNAIYVTEIAIFRGPKIRLFGPHMDEVRRDPTNQIGDHDGFANGPWDGPRITTVSE